MAQPLHPPEWPSQMNPIAELSLDLEGYDGKVVARLFPPQKAEGAPSWTCRFEVSEPFSYGLDTHGVSSLQALAHGLKGLATYLYASEEYRSGWLGSYGTFGGYLGLPAPNALLDEAPFPF